MAPAAVAQVMQSPQTGVSSHGGCAPTTGRAQAGQEQRQTGAGLGQRLPLGPAGKCRAQVGLGQVLWVWRPGQGVRVAALPPIPPPPGSPPSSGCSLTAVPLPAAGRSIAGRDSV